MTESLLDALRAGLGPFAWRAVLAAAVLLAFWVGAQVAASLLRRLAARLEPGRDEVVRLLAATAHAGILAVGAVSALGTAGIEVGALVAGLGLTGFALGFALRDALSNLLAGVLILFYRPFRPGDHVQVGAAEGLVRSIDLRYTILETEGRRHLVPNSVLLTQVITVREPPPQGSGRDGW
ncbi:mechanosensitive ion channel family protein [Inmirania thermothiophila]|uniref:Small-conductance mechanosensitive channel n=1 Tax=Inmirania thermothiophila TaxID=1750597 RepID=A0A3N1Y8S9_9GAMM|nr:mechanosensitive ion channel domain-containing protein [Inmirania thermothiophila]ROR34898.1 mechanosensitive ion channel-like protein [Inmirania thermothiophila]